MCWKSPVYILICTAIAASAVVCSGFQLILSTGWLVSAHGSQARVSTGFGCTHALQEYLPRLCWVLTTSSWAGTLRGLWGSESGGMVQKKAVSTHWVCLGKGWVHTQRIIQDTAPAALQQQICWSPWEQAVCDWEAIARWRLWYTR